MPDSDQISEFRYQLTRLAKRLRQVSQNDPQTWSRMLVISAIDRMGSDVTPSELARAEDLYSSNLAALLKQLENEGLVERRSDLSDRRKVRVRLTESGEKELARSRKRRDDWLEQAIRKALTEKESEALLSAAPFLGRIADITEFRAFNKSGTSL